MSFMEKIADLVRLAVNDDIIRANVMSNGEVFYVIEDSDTDFNVLTQRYPKNVFTTLEAAYAATVTNRNDIIMMSGHSTHSLSAGIDWTKNKVHVISAGAGNARRLVQQGTKIQVGGAIDSAYVIKVTGQRNSFTGCKFIMGSTHANALTVLQEGGEGNLYDHCSFVFGVVNNLGGTTAHEVVTGSDSATYIDCTFGSDTLLTSAARSVFHIDQVTASQEFKSNRLKNCTFIISSSSSTATLVRLDAIGDVLFSNLFEECTFIASVDSAGGAAIAEAVQTGTNTVKGCLLFSYPRAFNVTDFSTATSGRNAAVQVVAPVSVAAAIEGIKPTA